MDQPMKEDSATAPRRPAPLYLWVVLVALLALVMTAGFWRADPWTLFLARYHADPQSILKAASIATPRDALGWWTGGWIQDHAAYYRPVTSMLVWLEWHLFGEDVLGFCAVGWVLHTLSTCMLFLLARRTFRGSPRRRLLMALLAAAAFTTPTRGNQRVAAADICYWPAQTDILSFAFAIASLLALDVALVRPGRLRLGLPLALAALSLLSKEMGVLLALPATLLAAARRRDSRPVALGYLTVTAAFLWIRFLAVPTAKGPEWKPAHLADKALLAFGGLPGALLGSREFAIPAVAAALLAIDWWLWRRRVAWPWAALILVLVTGLVCQAAGMSWAAPLQPQTLEKLARCLVCYVGAWLLFLSRSAQPVTFALGALVAASLPVLHVGGVHYYYWAAAFWGVVYAIMAARLADQVRAARRARQGGDPPSDPEERYKASEVKT